MTQPPLLSIVVPAYNVQKYLLECLDSLSKDFDADCELLLVNDGSTDSTREIASAFMHRHTAMGMRLVDIPHGGVSSARNAGVRESRGEYIWMVDSDDVVIPGALATILAMLRRHRVDGHCFELIFWEENGESDNWTESRLPPLTVMKDIPKVLRQSFIDGAMYPCRHVFRKAVYERIATPWFPIGRVYEDNSTIPRLIRACESYFYQPVPVVRYRQRPGSIIRQRTRRICIQRSRCMRPVRAMVLEPDNSVARNAFDQFAWENVSHALSQSLEVEASRMCALQLVIRRHLLRTLIGSPWALVQREWARGKQARAAELVGLLCVPRLMYLVRRALARL